MNPAVTTVDLTGEELVSMLEENLEHTFSRDPYSQIGRYVKRGLGLKVYFKLNPSQGLQNLFIFSSHEAVTLRFMSSNRTTLF
jgi:hypothetical protein